VNRIVYEFNPVERFVCGTVGQPGERAFYLQARTGARITTVGVEKLQAGALAERISAVIKEIKRADPLLSFARTIADIDPLEQPIFEEFRVGVIGISFDTESEIVLVEMQCASQSDSAEELLTIDAEEGAPDILRVSLSLAQADAFARRTTSVVDAGRLPCPFCAIPIDNNGHLCPRANGYRR
jgi:uncharacterized repeat protein (TIGR03847 family)